MSKYLIVELILIVINKYKLGDIIHRNGQYIVTTVGGTVFAPTTVNY